MMSGSCPAICDVSLNIETVNEHSLSHTGELNLVWTLLTKSFMVRTSRTSATRLLYDMIEVSVELMSIEDAVSWFYLTTWKKWRFLSICFHILEETEKLFEEIGSVDKVNILWYRSTLYIGFLASTEWGMNLYPVPYPKCRWNREAKMITSFKRTTDETQVVFAGNGVYSHNPSGVKCRFNLAQRLEEYIYGELGDLTFDVYGHDFIGDMNPRGWIKIVVLCMENAKVCGHRFLEPVSQVSGLSC
jgi:hypothetical protein